MKRFFYFLRVWKSYWFRPYPLLDLAICRIIIVTYQLSYLIFQNYYKAIIEYTKLPDSFYDPLPIFRLLTLPFGWNYRPSLIVLIIIFGITIITGLTSSIGWKTRLSLLIFAYSNLFIQAYLYSFGDFHHIHAIMLITLGLLAFSPAGESLSIDDLERRLKVSRKLEKPTANLQSRFSNIIRQRSRFAAWPLLLTQWMFSLIYLSAAFSKLKSGLDWLNGYTLQYHLLRSGWQRGSLAFWFSQNHLLALVFSWISVLWELTFFLVLIFPQLTWLYIPVGVAFHVGIYVTMDLNFSQYIALYSVFIPWTALIRMILKRNPILSKKEWRK